MQGLSRRVYCRLTISATIATALLMLAADITHHESTFRACLVAFLSAAVLLIVRRTEVTVAILERERQEGYDAGYVHGRRVARPVLIKRDSAESSFGASAQLRH